MATDTQSAIDSLLETLENLLAAARADRIADQAEVLDRMDAYLAQLKVIASPSDRQVQQLRRIGESYGLLQLVLAQKTDEISRQLAGALRGQTGLDAYRGAAGAGNWRRS